MLCVCSCDVQWLLGFMKRIERERERERDGEEERKKVIEEEREKRINK